MKKLALLVKNKKFVLKFEENLDEFTYYRSDLRKVLSQAMELRDRSLVVDYRLYSVFGDFLPATVLRKLAKNLTLEDLPLY